LEGVGGRLLGYSHDFKYKYDLQRQNKLEDIGFKILRFGDQMIKNDMFNALRTLEITIENLRAEKEHSASQGIPPPNPLQRGS
jgi:very-short-patch-repair endonuclease